MPQLRHRMTDARVNFMDDKTAAFSKDLTGQVTVADVGAWKGRREEARSASEAASEKVREIKALARRHQQVEVKCQSRLFAVQRWERFRAIAENAPLQRLGTSLVITATIAAMGIILAGLITLDGLALSIGGCCGILLGMTVALVAVYYPLDSDLIAWEADYREQVDAESHRAADFSEQLRQAQLAADRARESLRHVDETYQRYSTALNSRRHRLLATDWRSLRGIPFEKFLAEVLAESGYQVQLTKATGDQGIDLLVQRDGVRTAVQVKGYADSVGNGAVQEAHTGMAFYGYQQCAVVTNSTFTTSAKSLARQIGCTLIDGSQIDLLIRGEIDL